MTETTTLQAPPRVDYRIEPTQYKHWKLSFEGSVARLVLDIGGGRRPHVELGEVVRSADIG